MVDIAAVRLLRPVRVLVAGNEPLFVMNTVTDLGVLGFHAVAATSLDRAIEVALEERVNVVVLDVSGGLAAAVATAAALDALSLRVRVVLAGTGRKMRSLGYDVVDASGPPEALAATVQRAFRGGPLSRPDR
jgi:hypothetical protein